jgi:dienelactone hydrolase
MSAALAALAASLVLASPQAQDPAPSAPAAQAAPAAPAPSAPAPATPAAPPTAQVKAAWGQEMAEALQKGNTDAVSARFAPNLVAALPTWRFTQAWGRIVNRAGKLVSIGKPEVAQEGNAEVVTVPLQHERADWRMVLVFDAQGLITTIRFAPASLAAVAPVAEEWRTPPYVNPKAFRDVDVKLGYAPWVLDAWLSLPAGKGPFPAVVLVHGSGPHDADETVGSVKPFRDLAWGLASQGIAVLRYEKRSKAYGDRLKSMPVTVKEEVLDDAVAAVEFLRANAAVDKGRVFVLGHSLGGTLAPRIAAAVPGQLAGVIVLAGSTRPVPDLVDEQSAYLVAAGAATEETAAALRAEAQRIREIDPRSPPPGLILGAPAVYWLDLAAYDPVATARKNAIPVLVLQGERDYQVTAKDLDGWRKGLEGAPFVKFQTFPAANHLFVNGQGKSLPGEYQAAGNVAPEVVEAIAGWVKGLPPRK